MVPIIAAILKGILGSEIQRAVGDDPAAQQAVNYGLGRVGFDKSKLADSVARTQDNYVEPVSSASAPSNFVEPTKTSAAQSLQQKFAEDNYLRKLGRR